MASEMERAMPGAQHWSSFPFFSWDFIESVTLMEVTLPSGATFCLLWPPSHPTELRILFQPQEFEENKHFIPPHCSALGVASET